MIEKAMEIRTRERDNSIVVFCDCSFFRRSCDCVILKGLDNEHSNVKKQGEKKTKTGNNQIDASYLFFEPRQDAFVVANCG